MCFFPQEALTCLLFTAMLVTCWCRKFADHLESSKFLEESTHLCVAYWFVWCGCECLRSLFFCSPDPLLRRRTLSGTQLLTLALLMSICPHTFVNDRLRWESTPYMTKKANFHLYEPCCSCPIEKLTRRRQNAAQ